MSDFFCHLREGGGLATNKARRHAPPLLCRIPVLRSALSAPHWPGMTRLGNAVLIACALFLLSAHQASARCYAPLEAEAEQGIRIHSELMVIGLNCNHMGKRFGDDLYGQHREFTARHGDLFAKYEEILMDFYKRNGDPNPEASLNTLRTKFANKISTDAAGIRPDIFCARYAPRIKKAHAMTRDQVRGWAATFYDSHPVSYPVCAGGQR